MANLKVFQWLDFESAADWHVEKEASTKEELPQGKLFLTNKRLLVLSCQTVNHARITAQLPDADQTFPAEWEVKFPSKKFELSYAAGNSVAYKFAPLENFRSMELKMEAGAVGRATVKNHIEVPKDCCGNPCWDCCEEQKNEWQGFPGIV